MSEQSHGGEPRKDVEQGQAPQTAPAKENSDNKPINPIVPAPVLPLNPQPSPSNLSTPSSPNKKKKCTFKRFKDWVEIIGIFGGVAGIVVLWFQYREMSKTTQVAIGQLQAMQGQFGAMTNQDYILQGQLDEMRQGRRLDERAWVTGNTPNYSPARDGTVNINVRIQNFGKTPAIHCQTWGKCVLHVTDIPTNDLQPNPMITDYTLSPTELTWKTINSGNIEGKSGTFYVFGTVWYEDIFTIHHWSQFCFVLNYTNGTFEDPIPGPVHYNCDSNYAD